MSRDDPVTRGERRGLLDAYLRDAQRTLRDVYEALEALAENRCLPPSQMYLICIPGKQPREIPRGKLGKLENIPEIRQWLDGEPRVGERLWFRLDSGEAKRSSLAVRLRDAPRWGVPALLPPHGKSAQKPRRRRPQRKPQR